MRKQTPFKVIYAGPRPRTATQRVHLPEQEGRRREWNQQRIVGWVGRLAHKSMWKKKMTSTDQRIRYHLPVRVRAAAGITFGLGRDHKIPPNCNIQRGLRSERDCSFHRGLPIERSMEINASEWKKVKKRTNRMPMIEWALHFWQHTPSWQQEQQRHVKSSSRRRFKTTTWQRPPVRKPQSRWRKKAMEK